MLADPLVQDPVGVTFDGDGRMYVLEMRSYMQDAQGSNSRAPISRISRHEDTDADGVYDRHTVFVDNMVMPRIVFPLEDGVILALETDNRDLSKYTDTDGDGTADKKELFYPNVGRVQNMEWQPGGMTWALDNWLYTTYNPFRLRIASDGRILREETDYVRNSFGNAAGLVTPAHVAVVRQLGARKSPWTQAELLATVPAPLANAAEWTLTASHNSDGARSPIATPGARWDTGAPQQPGMWFQIELPQPVTVAELQIDSTIPGGRGRGRAGRGAGPPPAGPVSYSVQVSMDGTSWGSAVAQGAGATPTTTMSFPRVQARFLRITRQGPHRTGRPGESSRCACTRWAGG